MGKIELELSDEELTLMKEAGYSNKAIKLFINQINVGKFIHPDGVSTYLGPCGDLIRLYLKIKLNIIEDAKFYYLGCPGSAAAASAMTTLLKGKTLDEAKKMTENDILQELGALPQSKHDCLKLSIRTLKKTIQEYEEQKFPKKIIGDYK